ncbi:GMC oxidoreductase [Wilcoxina mikolae CBS 423.85]|nr:GMC oxidoreductase [Wilcoxina mikolae CBS 423.85]
MYSRSIFILLITTLRLTYASPFPGVVIERGEDLKASYDYIVVGGGTSGLVVANRLTENPEKSVLVIEAGKLIPDDQADEILIPGNVQKAMVDPAYQWGITSQPVPTLGNNTWAVDSAKIVGGGSAINGMFFDRGSKEDYDSWEKLGNKGWGWEGLEPYFKKSETFHPPDPEQAKEFDIEYDPTAHGFTGPIQAAFPNFIYPQLKAIKDAMKKFRIPNPIDGTNGNAIGALWVSNAINPKSQTRSYAKTAYHDVAARRSNYHLLTQQQVTKILFDKNKKATGVTFSAGAGSTQRKVSAKAEIILAAGAIHSPQLLQLSGIGPKDLLNAHGIPVIVDLPGVGSNFQDHASLINMPNYTVTIPEPYIDPALMENATYNAQALAEYKANRTGPYTAGVGNGASFLPLPLIAPHSYKSLIKSTLESSTYLHPSAHSNVIAGFKKQRELLLDSFATYKVAVDEFIVSTNLQQIVVLIKPLSRGFIGIGSADPFAKPEVEFRTITHPTDLAIIVESVKYARSFMASEGLRKFKPVEIYPGVDVVSDEALAKVVVKALSPTLMHPACTCAMMKRELGGVVDDELKVYGVEGLRIVDASVMPLIPGSHLSSTVYAVAEKAADIIKGI